MALTKAQAYPLYFLLVTESSLVRNVRAANCSSANDFVATIQKEVSQFDPTAVVDQELGSLWIGQTAAGETDFASDAKSVLSALTPLDGYSGGPCPSAVEQQPVWDALNGLHPKANSAGAD